MSVADEAPPGRDRFPLLRSIPTRWMDNDHYGHVNNVAYYSFFDTAVNGLLMDLAGTDIRALPAIGVVAESSCRFLKGTSFPDTIHAGIDIEHRGTRSIVYRIALFRNEDADPCAVGRFVHVYVDRSTRRPVLIPDEIAAAVDRLLESARSST
jgi:acyl-CoA thioester hydrolase